MYIIYIITCTGSGVHIPAIEMTIKLNNHQTKHHIIHASVGSYVGEGYFIGDHIYNKNSVDVSTNDLHKPELVQMLTIDNIIKNQIPMNDVINVMVIDIEGSEMDALIGAKEIIKSKRILFFNIELWLRQNSVDVLKFDGLELLAEAGYKFYLGRNHPRRNKANNKIPKPITVRMLIINARFRYRVCKVKNAIDYLRLSKCLLDLYVLHPNVTAKDIYTW